MIFAQRLGFDADCVEEKLVRVGQFSPFLVEHGDVVDDGACVQVCGTKAASIHLEQSHEEWCAKCELLFGKKNFRENLERDSLSAVIGRK